MRVYWAKLLSNDPKPIYFIYPGRAIEQSATGEAGHKLGMAESRARYRIALKGRSRRAGGAPGGHAGRNRQTRVISSKFTFFVGSAKTCQPAIASRGSPLIKLSRCA